MGNILARDLEMYDDIGGTTEAAFCDRADLQEGVAGQARMDTTFENTERRQIKAPRSDSRPKQAVGYNPAPRNYRGDPSQYHGEWEDTGPPAGGPEFFR